MCLAVQKIQGPSGEKKKRKRKRPGRVFFGDEQAQDPEWWQEEDQRKERQAGLVKKAMASIRVVFARCQPDKGAGKILPRTKSWERTKKEKARMVPHPDSQPQKHPMRKDMARPGNQTIGLPVTGLMIPGLQMLGGSVCMDGGNSIESCQPSNTWFWILAAHNRLDQERQSKGSRSMHGGDVVSQIKKLGYDS